MTGKRNSGPNTSLDEQAAALARFGEFALRADSLDEVLTEACRLVGRGLNTDCAKVLERQPEGRLLVVRAGVGWQDGVVGRVIMPAKEDTAAYHALTRGTPVISADLEHEKRFTTAGFLREQGIRALANVVIRGAADGPPYGVLEVDSRTPRQFSERDIDFLRSYANLLSAAIQRMRFLQEVREGALAKERLLSELQHRVRNNLQVISSLIKLRRRRTQSDEARNELEALLQNIEPLRIVHDKLNWVGDVDHVDLGLYLGELSTGLLRFHGESAEGVRLQTDISHVTVSSEKALPIGLIVNEFITNSVKHAFDGSGGIIGVKIAKIEERKVHMQVWDTGKGLEKLKGEGGTGLLLIDGLIRQIGAEAKWSTKSGTRLALTFECEPIRS